MPEEESGSITSERDALVARIAAFEQSIEDVRLNVAVNVLLAVPLTIRQLKVLGIVLAGGGNVTSQRLATMLQVSLATTSGLIDHLVDSGMVIRVPSATDRRVSNLEATEMGSTLIRDLTSRSDRMVTETLERIPLADLRALTRGLEALGVALDANRSPVADTALDG
ncbi:MarR family winged helix-turn-helix transcriptional regulator [Cryobacterium sp. AP23]